VDETEIAAFDLLQCLFKTRFVLYASEVIRNPISKRGECAFFARMIMVKIHKISKRGLHTKGTRIEVPRRPRLHLDGKRADPPHIGVPISDSLLELSRLLKILLLFKRNTDRKEDVAKNLVLFQLLKALHQGLIGIRVPFMDPSHPL
jgi:hypothetical protein